MRPSRTARVGASVREATPSTRAMLGAARCLSRSSRSFFWVVARDPAETREGVARCPAPAVVVASVARAACSESHAVRVVGNAADTAK
jgi:hypothetical protein